MLLVTISLAFVWRQESLLFAMSLQLLMDGLSHLLPAILGAHMHRHRRPGRGILPRFTPPARFNAYPDTLFIVRSTTTAIMAPTGTTPRPAVRNGNGGTSKARIFGSSPTKLTDEVLRRLFDHFFYCVFNWIPHSLSSSQKVCKGRNSLPYPVCIISQHALQQQGVMIAHKQQCYGRTGRKVPAA